MQKPKSLDIIHSIFNLFQYFFVADLPGLSTQKYFSGSIQMIDHKIVDIPIRNKTQVSDAYKSKISSP